MDLRMEATDKYYPGFRKFNLFSDAVFRRVVVLVIGGAIIDSVCNYFIPYHAPERELVGSFRTLIYLLPVYIMLSGGFNPRALVYYVLFALMFGAGQAASIYGSPLMSALFFPAAAACFWLFHKNSRSTLASLGFLENISFLKEIVFIIPASAILIYPSYAAFSINHTELRFLGYDHYFKLLFIGLLTYGTLFGILYGVLTRRLLELRFQIVVPVVLNTLLHFSFWLPAIIGYEQSLKSVFAVFMSCLLAQFTMSMAYYYTRSVRVVILIYLIYYLFYKSAAL